MDPHDRAPAAPAWTARLGDLLRRAGVPASRVDAADGELAIALDADATAPAATVRVVGLAAGGPNYKATGRYGYRYATPGPETPALMARIDLAIAILARLEARLPDDWSRAGGGDPARAFAHRFPFASVDRSVGDDGRTEDQVLVRLTPRCNQDCPFCSAPDCAEPDDDALAACIDAAAAGFPGCLLTLTGGEPTLRRGWDAVLSRALALPGVGGVQVQTNAVTFATAGAAARVAPDPRLLWFVSLHALDAPLYDRITRTQGQLPRALDGLRSLLAAGHRVIVNAVVGSANAAHLADLAARLPGLLPGLPLPQLHVSVLMCPPHRPASDEWLIPYEELVPLLERAVDAAAASGLPMSPLVASTHASIPPCFVSPAQRARMSNRPLIAAGETGYEDPSRPWVKAHACRACEADARCLGVPAPYARRFGLGGLRPFGTPAAEATWQGRARALLAGRPDAQVRLADLVPPGTLPAIPCTRPWTRLELHDGGTYGPCCADYMAGRHFVPDGAAPADLWGADLLREYRVQMTSGGHPAGCRTTCPVLQGGQETPDRLVLRGGTAPAVDNRIRTAEAILAGRRDIDHAPASIGVPVTSICNFDCLMCECGERGTLDDQRTAAFWAGLDPWLADGADLDVNGGEPLASPVFRDWIRALAARDPAPVVGLVTNGSLLTPEWLASLPRLPFRAITISLNAATPATYLAVNRGVPWTRIRANLDALLAARRDGRLAAEITYSMVILKANLHEVAAFAELGLADGVAVRYLLPQRDRNAQSILTSADAMAAARDGLHRAADRLRARGLDRWADDAAIQADILDRRLAAGLLEPIGND